MEKKRVVVCGTRFGQFYIEALIKMENIEIVGILSNGSERSKECAKYYKLPLFTSIDRLPVKIDLACIAIKTEVLGGEGNKLALEFLERKINVLLEQPIHSKELVECVNLARRNNVKFIIGNLYVNLPAVKVFIENAKIILKHEKILFVNADFATQVSYPLLHILIEILKVLRLENNVEILNKNGPFHTMQGLSSGIEINFRAHNEVDKFDMDGYLHLLHQISIGFPSGRLTLVDTHGPVIWQPRIHFPKNNIIPGYLKDKVPLGMKEENIFTLYEDPKMTQKEIFTELWPSTIKKDVEDIIHLIDKNDKLLFNKKVQTYLLLCKEWNTLMKNLGYPNIVEKSKYQYFDNSLLKKDKDNEKKEEKIKLGMMYLNKACYITMLYYLQRNLKEIGYDNGYTKEELISEMNIQNKYNFIIYRWLNILTKEKYILKVDDKYYFDGVKISKEKFNEYWKESENNWSESLGIKSILLYFKDNANELLNIMTGSVNPTFILFPEGNFNLANELYSDMAIAKYLNNIIASEVSKLSYNKEIKILEIGAGTGSTTLKVCEKLKKNVKYIFSDVSDYFLNNAKMVFKDYKELEYRKINIDYDLENFKESVDVIIAVGVINNSKNIGEVLINLRNILNKNGYIFLVEAIGESAPMLISQAFMMEEAVDERQENNNTFLELYNWISLFEKSELKLEQVEPENISVLSEYNQKLFILKNS